jgi:ParB family chromosome partitioning protein
MTKTPKKHLGKGLSALLGTSAVSSVVGQTAPFDDLVIRPEQISPIEKIYPGRFQPRQKFSSPELRELADSIGVHGVLQPILVRNHPDKAGAYEIIAGERRWRAAQLAKLHEVPIVLRNFSDAESLEIGLVENLQRENLSSLEEAEGYRRLVNEFNHSQDDIAKTLGKSRPYVSNIIRLLNLPDSIKEMLRAGDLTAGHARALLNAEDPVNLAKKVLSLGLNVRQTEKLCKGANRGVATPGKRNVPPGLSKDPNILSLEKELGKLLGLTVEIDFHMGGGNLNVTYKTLEQLDGVLHILSNGKHGKRPSG